MEDVISAVQSCKEWSATFGKLLKNPSSLLTSNATDSSTTESRVRKALNDGKVVQIYADVESEGNRLFVIEPIGQSTAHVLHAWKDERVRAQEAMPIDTIVRLLKQLETTDPTQRRQARRQLWGDDFAEPRRGSEGAIRFVYILSGHVDEIDRETLIATMSRKTEFSLGQTLRHRSGKKESETLSFVFGAAGIISDPTLDKDAQMIEVAKQGAKSATFRAIAEGVGNLATKRLAPTFARAIGKSVVRANAVTGTVLFGLNAMWDVRKWAKNDITAVRLRQRLAEGAAGAMGGFAAAASTGVAGGLLLGPIGALVGAVVGGIAGERIGSRVGKKIDSVMWDEGEDSVMNSYEFFGWRGVKRGTRPVRTADEVVEAYEKKISDEKPKAWTQDDWATACTANLFILIRAMYPEFVQLLNAAEDIRKSATEATSVVSTAMLESLACM